MDESDVTALTARPGLTGRRSLAVAIEGRLRSGSTEMALSRGRRRDLLATLEGMPETQALSSSPRRLADDLESDLCGDDLLLTTR